MIPFSSLCMLMEQEPNLVAYMYWKETGDIWVWRNCTGRPSRTRRFLCVGVTDNIILSSTIGRNRNNIPGGVITAIIQGTEELISDLAKHDTHLQYRRGDRDDEIGYYNSCGFYVTAYEWADVIDNTQLRRRCDCWLASYGQALWTNYRTMGSNGLTSAAAMCFIKAGQKCQSFGSMYQNNWSIQAKDFNRFDRYAIKCWSCYNEPMPIIKAILNKVDRKQITVWLCGGGHKPKFYTIDELHVIKDNLFDTLFV